MVGEEVVEVSSEINTLQESAGETASLTQKGNFEHVPHPGCVYFIRVDDAIKIGFAGNFRRRLPSLQTSHEKSLEVLAVISAASIDTLEGTMSASKGDWIIQGIKGEFYPCKDDIFRMTYEAVDAA